MEAHPPSYDKATLIDSWDIVAQYMPSNDLCAASLVCSKWHATFAPHLWGNPASHFGLENDRVYVALTKFKRTLQTARLLVRSMTHTLHLPPAHAEIYYGPHSDWLRDTLVRLPNLQSLIVRGLPFFDHSALLALKQSSRRQVSLDAPQTPYNGAIELPGSSGFAFERPAGTVPSFGLRLLDASRCSNVTSHGLSLALGRFENLLYLDLSFTYPARDPAVLSTIRRLCGLQVLKLRGVSLKDEAVEALAHAIGMRVRSLDLRNNQVTDRGVRNLLEHCFCPTDIGIGTTSGTRSPSLLPYLGTEMLGIYQGEDFEGYLRRAFTGSFVSRLAIEDVPEGGITHLYIANNLITVEGISGLVRCKRLHVLDVGSTSSDLARHPLTSRTREDDGVIAMPGMEKLTPILEACAAPGLTFLRIDHGLITKETPSSQSEQVVPGRVELADTGLPYIPSDAAELDATPFRPPMFEMSAEPPTPRHELAGDPMQFVVSPATQDAPYCSDEKEVNFDAHRRGSALAPEVVDNLAAETDQMTLLSPVSALEEGISTMMSGTLSPLAPSSPVLPSIHGSRPRSYSSLIQDRKARLAGYKTSNHALHPAMLPNLSTLIVTNVPSFSTSRDEADRLIRFVKLCAEERYMAMQQAKLDYSLPPGRRGQAAALRESARKHFALTRLVIEVTSEQQMRRSSQASPWQHTTGRSLTEDRDTESLWNAAATDFSFFGDDEEEMFPSIGTGRFAFGSNDKEVSIASDQRRPSQVTAQRIPEEPNVDTISLLSSFRKERKVAHQRNLAAGAIEPETEGYWDGLIQVVRPTTGLRDDEDLDYYGNVYSGGFLYR